MSGVREVTAGRAMTVRELYNKKRKTHRLDGPFGDLIGSEIELTGVWLIWGGSNSGKTSGAMQLAHKLTEYGKVAYNSWEERDGLTIVLALKRARMHEVPSGRFLFLVAEPLDELKVRLRKPKSPDIVFIDSFQYARMRYDDVIDLTTEFPKKLFVIISQAQGKLPKGNDADGVKYAANVKIWIEGCRAFPNSRYGGQTPYTIWEPKAARYWGERERNGENSESNQ